MIARLPNPCFASELRISDFFRKTADALIANWFFGV